MRRGRNTDNMVTRVAEDKMADAVVHFANEPENPLNGMDARKAKNWVNKLIAPLAKGLFKDESWRPVYDIWEVMTAMGIDWVSTGNKYLHKNGEMSGKQWKFEVSYVNKNGRPATLYGVIVASGAGTVEYPLEQYDLVAYVM